MPILSPEQLEELRKIIRDGTTALSITTFGDEVSDEELQRLIDEGYIDPSIVEDLIFTAFEYGQLTSRLPLLSHKILNYDDFKDYLKKHPVTLSPVETAAYKIAAARAGTFCRGLGNRFSDSIGKVVINADAELARELQQKIGDKVAESIALREHRGQLVTRLREIPGQISRDWHRVAASETHLAHQEAFFTDAVERKGTGVMMAKLPDPGACPACRAAYLGPDGKPIIRPASWWQDQGSHNVGRKKADYNSVYGLLHPHCRCQLIIVPRGFKFSDEWQLIPEDDGLEEVGKSADFGGVASAIEGLKNPVGGMGNHGNPARTPGENILNREPVTEWPPQKDKPKKRRKPQDIKEKFKLTGISPAEGDRSHPIEMEQIQAANGETENNVALAIENGNRFKESLFEEQAARVKNREADKLKP